MVALSRLWSLLCSTGVEVSRLFLFFLLYFLQRREMMKRMTREEAMATASRGIEQAERERELADNMLCLCPVDTAGRKVHRMECPYTLYNAGTGRSG
jgi:hypothetical protein